MADLCYMALRQHPSLHLFSGQLPHVTLVSPFFFVFVVFCLSSPVVLNSTLLGWEMTMWSQFYVHILLWLLSNQNFITHPVKWRINEQGGTFNCLILVFITNLFKTLEEFWSPNWKHPIRAGVSSSMTVNHTSVFFHVFTTSGLNVNTTLHVNNRFHQSVI